MRLLALTFLSTLACSGYLTSPTWVPRPPITTEWQLAQAELAPQFGDRVMHIHPMFFNWRRATGPFIDCGGVKAYGCFYPERRLIEWHNDYPQVIRHEAAHAILWRLGCPEWSTYGH